MMVIYMEKRVLKTIEENKLIKEKDNILIGLSGGPDSMALLYLLKDIQEKLDFRLYIAHVNHGLRGEDALSDENFVRDKAKELNLPFYIKKADMLAYGRERGISSEEAGREIRYNFFKEILLKLGGGKIAVAHNKNDQAETLLMRIIRGTGIDGLKGMDFINGNIIRPILNVSREDIESYIEENKIETVLDKTNLQSIYTRNRIRLELIPYLEENFNPNILEGLWRLSKIASIDSNFLDNYSKKRYNFLLKNKSKNCIILDGDLFENEDISIKQRIIRRGILDLNNTLQGVSGDHIISIMDLHNSGNTGKEVHLANGIIVKTSYGNLIFEKNDSGPQEDFEFKLANGINKFEELGISINISVLSLEEFKNDKKGLGVRYFDYDRIRGTLRLRNRRNGDRFRPFGMKGSKKLKDYFIDEKIPRDLRDRIPLILDGEDIIWVTGYRTSDIYKIDENTSNILKIDYHSYK